MAPVPMQFLNGLLIRKPNRNAPTNDYDLTPRMVRRFVAASGVHDVQLHGGLRDGIASGLRINVPAAGYLMAASPIIPGQQRGQVGGFHKRGPDPLSMAALWQNGPGSQPANPGGPGHIAGPYLANPMTG